MTSNKPEVWRKDQQFFKTAKVQNRRWQWIEHLVPDKVVIKSGSNDLQDPHTFHFMSQRNINDPSFAEEGVMYFYDT